MSAQELPSLAQSAAAFLVAAPFLLLALRRARALLPERAAPAHRWKSAEVLAVCLTPFAVAALVTRLLPGTGILQTLLLNQLVLGSTAGVAVLLAGRRPEGLADLGLAAGAPPRAFLAAPLVFLPGYFVSVALGSAWLHVCRARGWEEEQEVVRLILSLEGRELVLAALIAVLVGPFLEELLFRGFLQSVLSQVGGPRGGLVLGSAVFASLHGVAGLPVLFMLSLLLGWLQLRTGSLLVPWSAHALHNAIMLGIALAAGEQAV